MQSGFEYRARKQENVLCYERYVCVGGVRACVRACVRVCVFQGKGVFIVIGHSKE